ncbi:MAG: DUF3108 domain-containing protein [Immundisolibacteraceae bacterium]|nr:DUF3108 domain-containing protein [Immundisolibacteraceae bacterium]
MIRVACLLGVWLLPFSGQGQSRDGELSASHWIARYSVSHLKQVVGEMRRETRIDDQHYSIRSDLVPKGIGRLVGSDLIEQVSKGDLFGNRLRPQHYFFFQSSKPEKPRDFNFDWSVGAVSFADKTVGFSGELDDELSQLVELRRQLAAGQQVIELQVLSGSKRRIYDYHYQVEKEQVLAVLPANKPVAERTLQVLLTTSRGKYEMRLWMAIERDYLPLRIERTEIRKNRTAVMVLTGFEHGSVAE